MGNSFLYEAVEQQDRLNSCQSQEEIEFTSDIKVKRFELKFDKLDTRWIKVKADCIKIPNRGAFIFTDELIVN